MADVLASVRATDTLDAGGVLVAVAIAIVGFGFGIGAMLLVVKLYREGTPRRQALMRGALGGSFVLAATTAWNADGAFPMALMITYLGWVLLIDVVVLVGIGLQRRRQRPTA